MRCRLVIVPGLGFKQRLHGVGVVTITLKEVKTRVTVDVGVYTDDTRSEILLSHGQTTPKWNIHWAA